MAGRFLVLSGYAGVAPCHLVDLVGCRDERLAELPRVNCAAEREALVAALSDIDVTADIAFARLYAPTLNLEVALVRVVGAVNDPLGAGKYRPAAGSAGLSQSATYVAPAGSGTLARSSVVM